MSLAIPDAVIGMEIPAPDLEEVCALGASKVRSAKAVPIGPKVVERELAEAKLLVRLIYIGLHQAIPTSLSERNRRMCRPLGDRRRCTHFQTA